MATGQTKISNLINPQVMADMIDTKLANLMKFAPLATVDTTLSNRAGDTITLPKFAYIGDAADVAEGVAIPLELLTASSTTVTVKKAGKGVEITDEAVLSGYGDPVGEATNQLALSIAQKVDNDVKTALAGIAVGMTSGDGTAVISGDLVATALVKFGEDVDGEKVLLIAPEQLATLRKDTSWLPASEIKAQILMSGTVGMIHGCQVAISNKVAAVAGKFENYIVKPGALRVFLKRNAQVETDRDIVKKTNIITADKHYVAYLYDQSKAIKISAKQ